MRRIIVIIIVLLCLIGWNVVMNQEKITPSSAKVQYISLGDSYTIGEGVKPDETFPSLLTKQLRDEGVDIELVANPSVTGYTTDDLIARELPIVAKRRPNFVTVLIGANDYVRGVTPDVYRQNLITILDTLNKTMQPTKKIILITIPDFAVTPVGSRFDTSVAGGPSITDFNTILKEEGEKRGLPVVDIFPISKAMASDSALINPDGLHPSSEEYRIWTELLYPIAKRLLTTR